MMDTTKANQEYIAVGNKKKQQLLEHLTKQINENRDILFTNYRGLNVENMSLLREQVQRHDALVCVIKNRLVFKALVIHKKTDSKLEGVLKGPTAVVFANNKGMEVLQDIVAFNSKQADIPCSIKGAFIENMFYTEEHINMIKDLPPRDVLISRLMGAMMAPIQSLTQLVQELVATPVRLLSRIGQSKKE